MGFFDVLVPPSPKVQAHAVGVLVEASVKVTVWPTTGVAGAKLKAAEGATTAGLTVTVWLAVLDPPELVAVRLTVKVPAVAKAWDGFCALLVPPSPKVQAHAVGVLEEASVKVTVWLVTGDPGANVKAVTGAVTTGWELLEPPPPHPMEARTTNKAPTIGMRRMTRMTTPARKNECPSPT